MKKLSLILAGALLLGGISFAAPVVKQAAPAAKQTTKPVTKPIAKPTGKPTVKPTGKPTTKPTTKPVVHHGHPKKTPPKKIAK